MSYDTKEEKNITFKIRNKLTGAFVKNIIWNFSGMLLPMLVAFFMIPIVIHHTGLQRFGVFSLVIMMIGAMTLFDFGLTRSITHSASKYYSELNSSNFLSSIKCGWVTLTLIVVLISFSLFFFSDKISLFLLKIPEGMINNEVILCIKTTAIALPFVMSQAIFSSVMESLSAFRKINIYRTPFWMLMYAVPLVVSYYTSNIYYLTLSIFILRIIMAIAFYFLMMSEIKKFTNRSLLKASMPGRIIKEIITYGGWISLGNLIVPVMLYLDRLIIASAVGPEIYPYYGTPYEVISRITIITGAVCSVLFPLLSGRIKDKILEANSYYKKSILLILIMTLPCAILGISFSKLFLSLWINPSFADKAWITFSILLVGFLTYGLFQPAFIWIMAAGKPWITTAVQLFDLFTYIIYLPLIAREFGIEGAAIGWDLRMFFGMVLMFFIRHRMFKQQLILLGRR